MNWTPACRPGPKWLTQPTFFQRGSMLTMRVDISDFTFAPESLNLKAGQPYKLELFNTATMALLHRQGVLPDCGLPQTSQVERRQRHCNIDLLSPIVIL